MLKQQLFYTNKKINFFLSPIPVYWPSMDWYDMFCCCCSLFVFIERCMIITGVCFNEFYFNFMYIMYKLQSSMNFYEMFVLRLIAPQFERIRKKLIFIFSDCLYLQSLMCEGTRNHCTIWNWKSTIKNYCENSFCSPSAHRYTFSNKNYVILMFCYRFQCIKPSQIFRFSFEIGRAPNICLKKNENEMQQQRGRERDGTIIDFDSICIK